MNWTRDDVSVRSRFRGALRRAGIPDGSNLVLAVSGGSDSLSLLDLTAREAPSRRWRLRVVHIDHGWREGSAQDAAAVREEARRRGLASTGLRIRSTVWARGGGESREAIARSLRRHGLRRVARRTGAEAILLGHTRDDQVETILLHLLRGTGLRGLVGMEVRRGLWVRPLLDVGREELKAYLGRRGLGWQEDPTNTDPAFLRNRVRHRLLPLIESEIRPGTDKVLLRMADALKSLERRHHREVADCWRKLAPRRSEGAIHLDRPPLATYDADLVEGILQRAFRAVSGGGTHLGQAHLRALEQAVRDSAPRQFDLPAGVRAFVNAREVRLVRHGGRKKNGSRPRLTS